MVVALIIFTFFVSVFLMCERALTVSTTPMPNTCGCEDSYSELALRVSSYNLRQLMACEQPWDTNSSVVHVVVSRLSLKERSILL